MLNASFDREAITVKVMGIISALAALASFVMMIFGMPISTLFVAIANGLLAFICFVEFEDERIIFAGSLGLIVIAEVISLITGKGAFTNNAFVIIVNIGAHLGMILYIISNRVSRFKAIWIGAVCTGDVIWKAIMIPTVMKPYLATIGAYSGLPSQGVNLAVALVVIYVLMGIIPALAVTLFLFTGALDYGN